MILVLEKNNIYWKKNKNMGIIKNMSDTHILIPESADQEAGYSQNLETYSRDDLSSHSKGIKKTHREKNF